MINSKVSYVMFGVAAGVATGAALIGVLLIGASAVIDLQADAGSVLTQHPLFLAGTKLISSGALASLPLLVLWGAWKKQ